MRRAASVPLTEGPLAVRAARAPPPAKRRRVLGARGVRQLAADSSQEAVRGGLPGDEGKGGTRRRRSEGGDGRDRRGTHAATGGGLRWGERVAASRVDRYSRGSRRGCGRTGPARPAARAATREAGLRPNRGAASTSASFGRAQLRTAKWRREEDLRGPGGPDNGEISACRRASDARRLVDATQERGAPYAGRRPTRRSSTGPKRLLEASTRDATSTRKPA